MWNLWIDIGRYRPKTVVLYFISKIFHLLLQKYRYFLRLIPTPVACILKIFLLPIGLHNLSGFRCTSFFVNLQIAIQTADFSKQDTCSNLINFNNLLVIQPGCL
jgi:hypothetical protein